MAGFPTGNPICVFFHGKVSLLANPCLPLTDRSVSLFWQPFHPYSKVGPASETLPYVYCPLGQSISVYPHVTSLRVGCGLRSDLS